MKDHHLLADQEAVERSPDAFTTAGPELEEPFTHRARMWHPNIGTELDQEFDQPCMVRQNANRPWLDVVADTR